MSRKRVAATRLIVQQQSPRPEMSSTPVDLLSHRAPLYSLASTNKLPMASTVQSFAALQLTLLGIISTHTYTP